MSFSFLPIITFFPEVHYLHEIKKCSGFIKEIRCCSKEMVCSTEDELSDEDLNESLAVAQATKPPLIQL